MNGLAAILPAEYVQPVGEWLNSQLATLIADRARAENLMRTLGASGETLAAYRDATDDIRDLAARWAQPANGTP